MTGGPAGFGPPPGGHPPGGYPPPQPPPQAYAPPCPFCGTPITATPCTRCLRDPRAPRRICGGCQRATPTAEPACMHCQVRAGSELSWKVPLIVVMFLAAIALSIALRTL